MNRSWVGSPLAACALALVVGCPAWGNLIPYTERWTASPSPVFADSPGGRIAFRNVNTLPRFHQGNTSVVAANLRTFSTAPASDPVTFTAAPASLTVHLFDVDSGDNGALTFTGAFYGTLSRNTAHIWARPTSPIVQSIVLGHNTYWVALTSFSPPGPPGRALGSITAYIRVHPNPEPSSILLASLACPFVGLLVWRRRRKAPVAETG